MKAITLSSLALAVGVTALPYLEDVAPSQGVINMGNVMEAISALAEGKLASLMGSDNATEQFADLARLVGAGPGKAGDMSTILRDVINGEDLHQCTKAWNLYYCSRIRKGCAGSE